MIIVKDVVCYNLDKCNTAIHDLKVFYYVERPLTAKEFELMNRGYTKPVHFYKVVSFINPKCTKWSQYIGFKKECTKWLGALLYLKAIKKNVSFYEGKAYYAGILNSIQKRLRKDCFKHVERWKENKDKFSNESH